MRNKYLAQDFTARITGGILFWKNKPYMVVGTDTNKIAIRNVYGGEEQLIDATDPEIDLSSPKIGYVNRQTSTVYLTRNPLRRYKQTLSPESVSGWVPFVGYLPRETITAVFSSRGIEKMFADDYPDAKTVVANLRKSSKLNSQAIARNIALGIDSFDTIHVFFKTDEVGIIKPNEFTVRIPSSTSSWIVSKYLDGFGWEIN